MSLADGPIFDHEYRVVFSSYRLLGQTSGHGPEMTISQRGMIPEWAKVLIGSGVLNPAINGIDLAGERPSEGNLAYWDVREFAGREGELSFHFLFSDEGQGPVINIIGFSTLPEPSTYMLLLVGAALLFIMRKATR